MRDAVEAALAGLDDGTFRTAEKFGKEKCADAKNWKQNETFIEHERTELIQKDAIRHLSRGKHEHDAEDCVQESKQHEDKIWRRQIPSGSGPSRNDSKKQQEQRDGSHGQVSERRSV